MEVDTILVVPGVVNAEAPYDEVYHLAREGLSAVASDAERLRVAIGVENVWNKFLLSPLEFARFVDEIGSPTSASISMLAISSNMATPNSGFRSLGNRIKKVHVKDFKSNIGNGTGFCNPLQGDVPWAAVRAALERIGYDEYITAEVAGYKVHPELD